MITLKFVRCKSVDNIAKYALNDGSINKPVPLRRLQRDKQNTTAALKSVLQCGKIVNFSGSLTIANHLQYQTEKGNILWQLKERRAHHVTCIIQRNRKTFRLIVTKWITWNNNSHSNGCANEDSCVQWSGILRTNRNYVKRKIIVL